MELSTTRIEFPVYLTDDIRQTADKFAKNHTNPKKAKQIRLNTLAVLVAKYYCEFLDMESDLITDSWNPAMQLFFDQADLNLKGLGKLECCPILPGENRCYIPEEVRNDRIGYMVIKIDEEESEGWILGFVPKFESEYLYLDNLQSLYDFIDYVEGLRELQTIIPFKHLRPYFEDIRNIGGRLLEKTAQAIDSMIETLSLGAISTLQGQQHVIEDFGAAPASLGEKEQEETAILDPGFISELDKLLSNSDSLDSAELASELSNLLNTLEINEQNKLILPSIIQLLTTLDINSPDVVEAITSLSEKVTDDEVVCAVAFSLARLQPDHEKAAQIKYNTPLAITSNETQDEIYLCVATLPEKESNDQKRLWVQIVNNSSGVLPPGLKLVVSSDADEQIYELETEEEDKTLLIITESDTLPLFSLGTNLHISVTLQDVVKEIDIIV